MLLELRQLKIQPGQQLLVEDVNWAQINVLQAEQYIESDVSPTFPNIPIVELVNQYAQQSQVAGRTQAIQAFKNWVRENL